MYFIIYIMDNKHNQNLRQEMKKKQETKRKLMRLKLWAIENGFNSLSSLCSFVGITYPHLWSMISGRRRITEKFLKIFKEKTGKDFLEIIEE